MIMVILIIIIILITTIIVIVETKDKNDITKFKNKSLNASRERVITIIISKVTLHHTCVKKTHSQQTIRH